jgi:hypothetical protein
LVTDLVARISRGDSYPDGSAAQQGEVIIATAEDGPGDTIRPRLDAHNADVTKVFDLGLVKRGESEEFFSFDAHLGQLDAALLDRPNVRLLVVDPISAYMGNTDSHNNSEVRRILAPVAKLADKHNVAVLGIHHLSKRDTTAINRVNGSIAFVAAPRAVWLVARDPDDDERRLFLPVKNNLAHSNGLAYRIENDRVVWEEGQVLVSADDVDAGGDETPREEAVRWLREKLEAGQQPAKSLLKEARDDGIADRTLKRAKKDLKIKSVRQDDRWVWSLPAESDEGEASIRF